MEAERLLPSRGVPVCLLVVLTANYRGVTFDLALV